MAGKRLSWDRLQHAAKSRFGIEHLQKCERQILENLSQGKHVLGMLPSREGAKRLFQLPSLFLSGPIVVVSSKDNMDSNSIPNGAQENSDVYFASPTKLVDGTLAEKLKRESVSLLILDDVQCISEFDEAHTPAYAQISSVVKSMSNTPILALCATQNADVCADVLTRLQIPSATKVRLDTVRSNLSFSVCECRSEEDRKKRLLETLRRDVPSMVYVSSVKNANEIGNWLQETDTSVAVFHSRLSQKERYDALQNFCKGQANCFVTTHDLNGIASRDFDKTDVRSVIHYNVPDSIECYLEEVSRAGRDGVDAEAHLFFTAEDLDGPSVPLAKDFPTKTDALSIYQALCEISQWKKFISPKDLREFVAVSEKRIKVVLGHLRDAGIVQGVSRSKFLGPFSTPASLHFFLRQYEERQAGDLAKFQQMLAYAQANSCRYKFIHEYFGELDSGECGVCDNCAVKQPSQTH